MQNIGFIMMFILFLICGVAFPQLTSSAQGLRVFQFLYFFSSFWNQVGPLIPDTLGLLQVSPGGVLCHNVQSTFACYGLHVTLLNTSACGVTLGVW